MLSTLRPVVSLSRVSSHVFRSSWTFCHLSSSPQSHSYVNHEIRKRKFASATPPPPELEKTSWLFPATLFLACTAAAAYFYSTFLPKGREKREGAVALFDKLVSLQEQRVQTWQLLSHVADRYLQLSAEQLRDLHRAVDMKTQAQQEALTRALEQFDTNILSASPSQTATSTPFSLSQRVESGFAGLVLGHTLTQFLQEAVLAFSSTETLVGPIARANVYTLLAAKGGSLATSTAFPIVHHLFERSTLHDRNLVQRATILPPTLSSLVSSPPILATFPPPPASRISRIAAILTAWLPTRKSSKKKGSTEKTKQGFVSKWSTRVLKALHLGKGKQQKTGREISQEAEALLAYASDPSIRQLLLRFREIEDHFVPSVTSASFFLSPSAFASYLSPFHRVGLFIGWPFKTKEQLREDELMQLQNLIQDLNNRLEKLSQESSSISLSLPSRLRLLSSNRLPSFIPSVLASRAAFCSQQQLLSLIASMQRASQSHLALLQQLQAEIQISSSVAAESQLVTNRLTSRLSSPRLLWLSGGALTGSCLAAASVFLPSVSFLPAPGEFLFKPSTAFYLGLLHGAFTLLEEQYTTAPPPSPVSDRALHDDGKRLLRLLEHRNSAHLFMLNQEEKNALKKILLRYNPSLILPPPPTAAASSSSSDSF